MSGARKNGGLVLAVIAVPAAVAIWSGWVGLGAMCGFGPVRLLPGISDLTINTAITLPIGVEAYAAYALHVWISPGSSAAARKFGRRSAVGALIYGAFGQVVYHLLAAAGAAAAPWPVVVVVSCMPITVVAFAAALIHLQRAPASAPARARGTVPSSSFEAAKARMAEAAERGFKYSDNEARADFGLTRAQVTNARREAAGRGPGVPPSPAGNARAAKAGAGTPPMPVPAANGNGPHGG